MHGAIRLLCFLRTNISTGIMGVSSLVQDPPLSFFSLAGKKQKRA